MTLAKVKNLYDQDFALWIEKTVKQLSVFRYLRQPR